MSPTRARCVSLIFAMLLCLTACPWALADVGRVEAPLLPGSAVAVGEAATAADTVAVGNLQELVLLDPSAPGRANYQAEIVITKVMKGAQDLARVACLIRVESHIGEVAPGAGQPYLFFLTSRPAKRFTLIKMLIASDANIAVVAKAIGGPATHAASAPAPNETDAQAALVAFADAIRGLINSPPKVAKIKAFYTTDDGKTYFEDSADLIAPFIKDGKEALKAIVVTCDGGKTKHVAYVQRVTPMGKKLIAELPKRFPPPEVVPIEYLMAIDVATEVKRPGPGKWESRDPRNLRAVQAITTAKCPDGGVAQPVFKAAPEE